MTRSFDRDRIVMGCMKEIDIESRAKRYNKIQLCKQWWWWFACYLWGTKGFNDKPLQRFRCPPKPTTLQNDRTCPITMIVSTDIIKCHHDIKREADKKLSGRSTFPRYSARTWCLLESYKPTNIQGQKLRLPLRFRLYVVQFWDFWHR